MATANADGLLAPLGVPEALHNEIIGIRMCPQPASGWAEYGYDQSGNVVEKSGR